MSSGEVQKAEIIPDFPKLVTIGSVGGKLFVTKGKKMPSKIVGRKIPQTVFEGLPYIGVEKKHQQPLKHFKRHLASC